MSACDRDSAGTRRATASRPAPQSQYAAIYFEHEGRLVPEYHPLSEGEPERALWELLVAGPHDEGLTTALDEGDELVQAAEPDEGRLLLEIDGDFWSQGARNIYRAAAQIVFTMGNLEEGGAITLIDGLRAGRVEDPRGNALPQPLTRDDFPPPLVSVVQPVAGATVARSIPIDLTLARKGPVTVSLLMNGEAVATSTVQGGRGRLVAGSAPAGESVVEIQLDPQVTVEVPVTIAPRS